VLKVLIHPLIKKYLQTSYFFGRWVVCAQTAIFFNELVSKKCGNYIYFMFAGRFRASQRVRNMVCAEVWRIFSSKKSIPANRKKGFFTIRQPNEEIGGTFVFSGSKLFSLFKNSKSGIKKIKHIAVNVLSHGPI
jgi:hypothetical protein